MPREDLSRMIKWVEKNLALGDQKLKPLLTGIALRLKKAAVHINSNRKLKYAIIIAGLPLVAFLIMVTVVLMEAPDKKVLKSFRNAVPSEVYTADGILIGRFSIQE